MLFYCQKWRDEWFSGEHSSWERLGTAVSCRVPTPRGSLYHCNTAQPVMRGHSEGVPTGQVSPCHRFISVLKCNLVCRKCNLGILTGAPSSQVFTVHCTVEPLIREPSDQGTPTFRTHFVVIWHMNFPLLRGHHIWGHFCCDSEVYPLIIKTWSFLPVWCKAVVFRSWKNYFERMNKQDG